jgi:hypothetical protein
VLAVAVPLVGSRLAQDELDQMGGAAPLVLPSTIALGLVGLVVAVYALLRRERSWRVWAGLVTSGLVMLFWLVFLIGELTWPH